MNHIKDKIKDAYKYVLDVYRSSGISLESYKDMVSKLRILARDYGIESYLDELIREAESSDALQKDYDDTPTNVNQETLHYYFKILLREIPNISKERSKQTIDMLHAIATLDDEELYLLRLIRANIPD